MKKPTVVGVSIAFGIVAVMVILVFLFLPIIYAETSEFADANGNGIPDELDIDTDGDGLPDLVEFVVGTDPFNDTSVVYIENLTEFTQQILENTTIETVI